MCTGSHVNIKYRSEPFKNICKFKLYGTAIPVACVYLRLYTQQVRQRMYPVWAGTKVVEFHVESPLLRFGRLG